MRKIIFSCIFINCASAAIPTIAIPNLVYSKVSLSPGSIYTNQAAEDGIKPDVNPNAIAKQIKYKLPGFNADVRGAIINSGRFKVVRMPKQDTVWKGDPAPVLKLVKANTKINNTNIDESKSDSEPGKKSNMPDYILLGKVSAITQDKDTSPVKDTDKYTTQYNIRISVDYKLIKTSDDSIMASFTAYADASDVKILTNGAKNQKQTHNIPKLIMDASKSLGQDVLSQLSGQFSLSSENYDNGSKVITDVKVYK
ncbi:MAG: hypothetical protein K0R94_1306 [Burkholderiales bacterium]|jgi:hypothetical protein|nr:hypothetical protein [Burkholderiales bacterium]